MNTVGDAAKIYNPWNPNNRDIPMSEIIRIARYTPKRVDLYRQACVHKSFVSRDQHDPQLIAPRPSDCMPLKIADNEHLEYVGDGILDAIVGEYLERRFPGEGEGFWTSLRSELVNNEHLGTLAFWHVQQWMIAVLETYVDFGEIIATNTNYKDQLLRYYQATFHQPPRYKEVSSEGPLHNRIFTMGVLMPDGAVLTTATARNKKDAEQEASRLALVQLGAIH
jgi:ribonuclease-3